MGHPDRYGQRLENTVTKGRNDTDGTPPESGFLRCKKCGYTMNEHRHPKGRGEGNSQPNTQLNGAVAAGDTTITVDSTASFPTPATGSITAFANNGAGTKITSAAHGLKGDKVIITSTTNYNGTFYISEITTDTFVIQKKFVVNDVTGTWTVPEHIYIYDAGTYATAEDVSSTYTAATGKRNKVQYTGISGTTIFIGCTGVTAHDNDTYVKGEVVSSGCPFCGTYNYN